ncbi:MAG TPA: NfeD family protein, partial [Mycobacteriales bacterium]|nr:NfeD family protein [Mycobacteriales bacterium]
LYVLGGVGLLLLLGGLVFGDAVDGALGSVFDAFDAGPGVTAALGAALTAVGFGGALLASPFGLLVGTTLGVGIGLAVGVATLLLVRVALGGPPDRVASSAEMIGLFGTVVSAVPAGGYGQVALVRGGSRIQVSARADEPLDAGTPVYVTEVLSATAVVVSRTGLLA